MPTRSHHSRRRERKSQTAEKIIREWEKEYPNAWILLEVTAEANGDPVRGKLIATAQDPAELHEIWKSHRAKGFLPMLTSGPAVVVSAA